jgi:hypothetical protein
MSEPENLVLKLLRDIRGEITDIHKQMATKDDVADVRSEVKSLRADVASDMINLEKRLGDRISHLNRAVVEYRVEQHLNLPPVESY